MTYYFLQDAFASEQYNWFVRLMCICSRCTTVPEDEGFDLIPRAVDSTWKLHAAWLTAPAEKLDMGEIDALLAASGAPLPMRPAF